VFAWSWTGQGVGQVPLDLRSLGSLVVAFSAWKWLLGPIGVAVLAVSRDQLASLKPVFKGPDNLARATYLPYQTDFKTTADRYTYSTANVNDWVYFRASLECSKASAIPRPGAHPRAH